ncbi:MAG: hypothetical protein KAT34_01345 [Candidatus Aminicenantes bacterium]|nr:hypothetical protein [Candidatus Aminicenantes bacterium]
MKSVQAENVTKYFSLLREFVDEPSAQGSKKSIAILALDHLQKITAGTDSQDLSTGEQYTYCLSRPRIDGAPDSGGA